SGSLHSLRAIPASAGGTLARSNCPTVRGNDTLPFVFNKPCGNAACKLKRGDDGTTSCIPGSIANRGCALQIQSMGALARFLTVYANPSAAESERAVIARSNAYGRATP